jgi:hypothetical protein
MKSRKRAKTGGSGPFPDLKLVGGGGRDATDADRIILRARGVDAYAKFFACSDVVCEGNDELAGNDGPEFLVAAALNASN